MKIIIEPQYRAKFLSIKNADGSSVAPKHWKLEYVGKEDSVYVGGGNIRI